MQKARTQWDLANQTQAANARKQLCDTWFKPPREQTQFVTWFKRSFDIPIQLCSVILPCFAQMQFRSFIVLRIDFLDFITELHYEALGDFVEVASETSPCNAFDVKTINYQYERQISRVEFYHSNPSAPFHGHRQWLNVSGTSSVGKAILFLFFDGKQAIRLTTHRLQHSTMVTLPNPQQILRRRLSMAFLPLYCDYVSDLPNTQSAVISGNCMPWVSEGRKKVQQQ